MPDPVTNNAADDDLSGAEGAVSRWHFVAPWYSAYLILSLITSGMLPFLLPLMVATTTDETGRIAYIVGAYNAGLLPAPLLGLAAERFQLFRPVFFGGFAALSIGLGAAPAASALSAWVFLAVLCGIGAGAVATVAPLFVVNFAPKAEWDTRIGWLQSCSGAGQLAGLLLGGLLLGGPLAYGFWLAALLSIIAIVVGHLGLPADKRDSREMRLPPLPWRLLIGGFHAGPPLGGVLHHSHHLQGEGLRLLAHSAKWQFVCILLAWAAIHFAVAPFFAYYPLMMNSIYGIAPATIALVYAVAAAIGIGLFILAGHATRRFGTQLVFMVGLGGRISGFATLAAVGLLLPPGTAVTAILGFTLVVLAWPILSVSGTGLTATLTPVGEGAAMGLLACSGAISNLLGIAVAGPLVEALGYQVIPAIAIAGLLAGAVLSAPLTGEQHRARARDSREREIPPLQKNRAGV